MNIKTDMDSEKWKNSAIGALSILVCGLGAALYSHFDQKLSEIDKIKVEHAALAQSLKNIENAIERIEKRLK